VSLNRYPDYSKGDKARFQPWLKEFFDDGHAAKSSKATIGIVTRELRLETALMSLQRLILG
jgi:hypothetical protein